MTIEELIKKLQTYDPKKVVYCWDEDGFNRYALDIDEVTADSDGNIEIG